MSNFGSRLCWLIFYFYVSDVSRFWFVLIHVTQSEPILSHGSGVTFFWKNDAPYVNLSGVNNSHWQSARATVCEKQTHCHAAQPIGVNRMKMGRKKMEKCHNFVMLVGCILFRGHRKGSFVPLPVG
jgi:hypothetical protein